MLYLQRFPNQNVSELQRDDLLKLYSMYAIPKARRIKGNEDVEMKAATEPIVRRDNEHKRSRHHLITAPTVETVTNACKKIRLINTDGIGLNGTRAINTQEVVNTKCMGLNNKRQCEPEPMVISFRYLKK